MTQISASQLREIALDIENELARLIDTPHAVRRGDSWFIESP